MLTENHRQRSQSMVRVAHMDVTDPNDVLGKIFYVRQKEKSYYFEAQ